MYQYLFSPGNIGCLKLKNRIVMAPMGIVADTEGGFSKRQMPHHAARVDSPGKIMNAVKEGLTAVLDFEE